VHTVRLQMEQWLRVHVGSPEPGAWLHLMQVGCADGAWLHRCKWVVQTGRY
jgi:hypothetical protein